MDKLKEYRECFWSRSGLPDAEIWKGWSHFEREVAQVILVPKWCLAWGRSFIN